MIGGIDEAGRGPIIGNLVVAGICADPAEMEKWKSWGVKDSKKLTPKKREALYERLIVYPNKILEMPPAEIDNAALQAKHKRLNHLEAIYMAKVIDSLCATEPCKFFVDCPDVDVARFGTIVMGLETINPKAEVIASHHADRDQTIVGAASILAKVTRDRKIAELKNQIGEDFGSGYPSDPKTRAFITKLIESEEPFPDYIRKSWKTISRIQYTLDGFMG